MRKMIVTKEADRWILESETKNGRDFIHEFFSVTHCTSIALPRKVPKCEVYPKCKNCDSPMIKLPANYYYCKKCDIGEYKK